MIAELTARSCSPSDAKGEGPFRDLEIVSLRIDPAAAPNEEDPVWSELAGILLDEALLVFQAEGFEIVYADTEGRTDDYRELLRERGFVRIPGSQKRCCTDLRTSLVVFGDAAGSVREPFCNSPALLAVQRENTRRLRIGVAGLYPGKAVLFINSGILYYRLTKKIREQFGPVLSINENDATSDERGISVPFGKILKTCRIPGMKTVALNLERVYMQDLSSFSIRESAGYPKLSVQIRNLRSMGGPIVLVDDCYHNGFRMQEISRSLKAEGINEERLVVGVISGIGRENTEKNGLKVDAVYDIPGMKACILETDLIPFYCGDRVTQTHETQIRASIYQILPYQMPAVLRDAPYQAVYDVSMICLENAKRLFEVLETLYEERYFRRLTMERLAEVIDDPGCPETVADSADALGEAVSVLLAREITRLKRFYVRRV